MDFKKHFISVNLSFGNSLHIFEQVLTSIFFYRPHSVITWRGSNHLLLDILRGSYDSTVTAGGHAHAHDPGIDIIPIIRLINNIIRLNSTRAIDWCINCHVWLKKKFDFFLVIFLKISRLHQKKSRIFFFNQTWQFIHQSIALVEFSRIMLFIKKFGLIYGQKCKKQYIFWFVRMGIFRGAKMPKSGVMLMRIMSIPGSCTCAWPPAVTVQLMANKM